MGKHRIPFRKRIWILGNILHRTGADKLLLSYIVFVFLDALIIMLVDPAIDKYSDGLWFCYAVVSTTGFGDVVVTSLIAKICAVILTIYSVLVIAIITGVIVNFYTRLIDMKLEKEKENREQYMYNKEGE